MPPFRTMIEQMGDPANWEHEPGSKAAEERGSIGQKLLAAGLPIALAFTAFRMAKKDGAGIDAAISSLAGYQRGAQAAAQLAMKQREFEATQQQQQSDGRQSMIRAMLPVVSGQGGDINPLLQAGGREVGVQVPRVETPQERTAREFRFSYAKNLLDAGNPRKSGEAFKIMGEVLNDPAFVEMGERWASRADFEEDETAAAIVPIIQKMFGKMNHTQVRALLRSDQGQKLLGDMVAQASKAATEQEKPVDEEMRQAKMAEIKARTEALERSNQPKPQPDKPLMSYKEVMDQARRDATMLATTTKPDPFSPGKTTRSVDPALFASEYTRLLVSYGEQHGYDFSAVQSAIESNGNPAAEESPVDSLNLFGIPTPDTSGVNWDFE